VLVDGLSFLENGDGGCRGLGGVRFGSGLVPVALRFKWETSGVLDSSSGCGWGSGVFSVSDLGSESLLPGDESSMLSNTNSWARSLVKFAAKLAFSIVESLTLWNVLPAASFYALNPFHIYS
jgi:hypothetical protein